MHNKLKARLMSLALSVIMVVSMLPTTALATEGGDVALGVSAVATVQSFDTLGDRFIPSVGEAASPNVYSLPVALGTPEEELNLPDELTAMVARADAPESESIPVQWTSNSDYKSDANGRFIYTAKLPEGYALADGVKLPQIYVLVGMQARSGTPSVQTSQLEITDETATADNLATKGWKWDKDTATLTLKDATFSVASETAIVLRIPVTLVLEGTNSIGVTGNKETIYAAGPLEIQLEPTSDTTISSNHTSLGVKGSITIDGDGKLFITTASQDSHLALSAINGNLTIKGDSVVHLQSTTDNAVAFDVEDMTIQDGAVLTAKVPTGAPLLASLRGTLTATGKAITCNTGSNTDYTEPARLEDNVFYVGATGEVVVTDLKIATVLEDYPNKTQNFSVKSDTANPNVQVLLPEIDGATYTIQTVYASELLNGTPSISGNVLTLSVSSQPAGVTAVVDVLVTGATKYNDFTMTVTITAVDKDEVSITGLTAATGLVYTGEALDGYTGTVAVQDNKVPASELVYTYTSTDSGSYNSTTAPTNAGAYKLVVSVADSNEMYMGAHADINFTIGKATITITADDMSAYVGDEKPALVKTAYTIAGKANADDLQAGPILDYESEPDMSKAGSVKIKASSAVVPNTDNYESDITYVDGTLTISTKSSGGGGGGSSSGGSTPPSNTIDTAEGSKGATNVVSSAIQAAIAAGTGKTITTRATFNNYNYLEMAGLKTINEIVAKESAGKTVNFKVNFDEGPVSRVNSRITVNPLQLAKATADWKSTDKLPLGVFYDQQKDSRVLSVNNLFTKAFNNKIVSVVFEQCSSLAVTAEFCAKLNLADTFGQDKQLYFYTYNNETNIYNRIAAPGYWVDKNGYAHINAPLGGSIIITDKPLTKK